MVHQTRSKLDSTRLTQTLEPNQTRRNTCEGTVPLPPRGCYQNNDITVVLSVCDITKSVVRTSKGEKSREAMKGMRLRDWDGEKDALTETAAASEGERGNKREKASSCGLAELTVNLGRFIFSGACCSLKGGQIYMPLLGLLWSSARGAGDGISRLRGRDGGRFRKREEGFTWSLLSTPSFCCLIIWPSASCALVELSPLTSSPS